MKPFHVFVVLSALFFGCFSRAVAQKEIFKSEFYLGAGAGTLFSKVDFVPGVSLTSKQNFFGGISTKFVTEKRLGLIAELNFAQRGWKEKFEKSSDFSYTRTLNYIELPFMTHIYFGDKVRFIINLGPQLSLLIDDKEQMSQALSDDLAARRAAAPDDRIGMQYKGMYEPKRFDYGLIGGVGMEFKTGLGDFNLEGRYYFGLGDIFTNRRSVEAFFNRSAARVIEVKLTYYVRMF